MNRDPRTRLPLAGLLIIFVAPLATLMIMVPTLFAGSVHSVEKALPAIISRLVPNPSPHERAPRSPAPGLPPVAAVPAGPTQPPTPAAAATPGAPPAQPAAGPAPVPSPVASPPPSPVTDETGGKHGNNGRHRRRRPQETLIG